jgi:hypothetical protein
MVLMDLFLAQMTCAVIILPIPVDRTHASYVIALTPSDEAMPRSRAPNTSLLKTSRFWRLTDDADTRGKSKLCTAAPCTRHDVRSKPMRLYSDMKAMTMLQAGVGPEADSRRTSLFGGVCVPLACMASKK